MKAKKTTSVEMFKNWANEQLKRTDEYATQEFKAGICTGLERVLHDSGNYNGFNHNYWNATGFKAWLAAGEPDFPEKNKYIGPEYDRCYN